jgi:hypothetical protein
MYIVCYVGNDKTPIHTFEKSGAIVLCIEMPSIPVYKVVDEKRICNWKKGLEEEERRSGSFTPPPPLEYWLMQLDFPRVTSLPKD